MGDDERTVQQSESSANRKKTYMSNPDMPVQAMCDRILQTPCPYKVPPFFFIGGHQFCPCICQALKVAYLGGYAAAKEGKPPEMGVIEVKEEPHERTNVD